MSPYYIQKGMHFVHSVAFHYCPFLCHVEKSFVVQFVAAGIDKMYSIEACAALMPCPTGLKKVFEFSV